MPQQLYFIKYTEAGTRYCFSNMLQVQTIALLCHDSTLFKCLVLIYRVMFYSVFFFYLYYLSQINMQYRFYDLLIILLHFNKLMMCK